MLGEVASPLQEWIFRGYKRWQLTLRLSWPQANVYFMPCRSFDPVLLSLSEELCSSLLFVQFLHGGSTSQMEPLDKALMWRRRISINIIDRRFLLGEIFFPVYASRRNCIGFAYSCLQNRTKMDPLLQHLLRSGAEVWQQLHSLRINFSAYSDSLWIV